MANSWKIPESIQFSSKTKFMVQKEIRGMAIISDVYSLLLDQFLTEIDENTQN